MWAHFDFFNLFFFFVTKASVSQFPVLFVNYGFKITCLIAAAVLARPQMLPQEKLYYSN